MRGSSNRVQQEIDIPIDTLSKANMAFGVFSILIIMPGTRDKEAGLFYRIGFILPHTIKSDFYTSVVLITSPSN
jgi:hypothetical protein